MDASSVLLANASVRVKRTRYGLMAYNINDRYVGRSLDCYGEYIPGQMALLAQLAPSPPSFKRAKRAKSKLKHCSARKSSNACRVKSQVRSQLGTWLHKVNTPAHSAPR
jgi:hypothetical protein